MRHLNSGRKLGRTASHRKATLSALSVALFQHKRIRTTLAKAKEMRMVVEPLITRAKNAVAGESAEKKNVHARRVVFAFLRDRSAVQALFNDIAPKVASRPGGYTRVVKLGQRLGDGAQVAIIELVDFNVGQDKGAAKPASKAATKSEKAAPKGEAKGTSSGKAKAAATKRKTTKKTKAPAGDEQSGTPEGSDTSATKTPKKRKK